MLSFASTWSTFGKLCRNARAGEPGQPHSARPSLRLALPRLYRLNCVLASAQGCRRPRQRLGSLSAANGYLTGFPAGTRPAILQVSTGPAFLGTGRSNRETASSRRGRGRVAGDHSLQHRVVRQLGHAIAQRAIGGQLDAQHGQRHRAPRSRHVQSPNGHEGLRLGYASAWQRLWPVISARTADLLLLGDLFALGRAARDRKTD